VQSAEADAEAQGEPTPVLIVDKLVPQGADATTIIASTHQGTVQLRSKQPGARADEGEIGRQVAAVDLLPGDQLVADRLTTEKAPLTGKVSRTTPWTCTCRSRRWTRRPRTRPTWLSGRWT
jgi:hypothetical protein